MMTSLALQETGENSASLAKKSVNIGAFSALYFVLQDPQLLDMSLRDNIALARPQANDEEIMRCATDAGIVDFIRSLPRGLDTVYGEDTQLSGGQEQRISIARALLADTPIIILDEATAMTDTESEADIQEALTRLARGRTKTSVGEWGRKQGHNLSFLPIVS